MLARRHRPDTSVSRNQGVMGVTILTITRNIVARHKKRPDIPGEVTITYREILRPSRGKLTG